MAATRPSTIQKVSLPCWKTNCRELALKPNRLCFPLRFTKLTPNDTPPCRICRICRKGTQLDPHTNRRHRLTTQRRTHSGGAGTVAPPSLPLPDSSDREETRRDERSRHRHKCFSQSESSWWREQPPHRTAPQVTHRRLALSLTHSVRRQCSRSRPAAGPAVTAPSPAAAAVAPTVRS